MNQRAPSNGIKNDLLSLIANHFLRKFCFSVDCLVVLLILIVVSLDQPDDGWPSLVVVSGDDHPGFGGQVLLVHVGVLLKQGRVKRTTVVSTKSWKEEITLRQQKNKVRTTRLLEHFKVRMVSSMAKFYYFLFNIYFKSCS